MAGVHNGDKHGQNGTSAAKYAPKNKKTVLGNDRGRVVGVISRARGGIVWVVSPHRQDKRTGATQTAPWGTEAQRMLDAVTPWGIAAREEAAAARLVKRQHEAYLERLAAQALDDLAAAEEEEQEYAPRKFVLSYVDRGPRGISRRTKEHVIHAMDVAAAREAARRFLTQANIPQEMRRLAALYEGERGITL